MNAEIKVSWLQDRFPELVVGLVVGAFALTLGELLLMGHFEGKQIIGLAMSAIAMGALVLGLLLGPRFRKVLVGVLCLVALGGLFGTLEHAEEAQEHREKAERARQERALLNPSQDGEAHEEGKTHVPPPLAPLSVSGLALMGGLGLIARKAPRA